MANLNSVIITGRVTAAPEVKESGAVRFTLATNTAKKDGEQYVEESHFINCRAFNNGIIAHINKGARLAVHGKLKQAKWQDESGNNRSALYVSVDTIELIDWDYTPQSPQ